MVIATDDLRDQLVQLLASLPPDVNPYLALSGRLRGLVLPAKDPHARNQLYVLSGVFALITLLSILSLWIRWRKGILWFARRSTNGLFRFHFSASWTVPCLVFLILLQPTMAFERQLFEGEGRRDFLYWLALPWLALSWSGIIATWAILSSHVAQLQARGKCTSSRCVRVVNSSGIVFLALYTLILVPPAVVVGHLYDKLIRDLDRVSDILTTLSQSWTGGLPDLVPATPVLEALGQAAIDYFRNLQILFTIFAAVSVVLALVMTIAGYFYLSLLRQEIESIGEPFSSHHGLVLRPTSSHIKLRRVWKTILFTVSVNVVIAVLLAVNSLMIAVAPEHLADRNHLRIALLMPLFSVGAFGLLSAVLLFVRALEAAPSDDKLTTAAREVVVEPRGGRKVAQESEEATMVGSASSLKGVVFKESGSRRSSWFGGGGTRTSGIPLQSKIMVDVEIQIDEERTTTCRSLEV